MRRRRPKSPPGLPIGAAESIGIGIEEIAKGKTVF